MTSYDGPPACRSVSSTARRMVRVPKGWGTGIGRRPVSTVSAASRITLSPRPPASTTPAARSCSSCSGVRASASRADCAAAAKTSRARARSSSARRTAASAAARATVRIVPSTGVPTAAYAASLASVIASAINVALRSPGVARAIRATRAPRSWLRITPLLPRAPSSAPRRNSASAVDRPASSAAAWWMASRAALIVRYMFVPVSPSGTG